MADILERRIGSLTVRIDRLLCVGFGDCIGEAPGSFNLDGDGVVAFTAEPERTGRELLLKACGMCPVDALSVFDADGRQLVP